MKKAATILVAAAFAVFGVAACGSDDSDDDTTAADTGTASTAAPTGASTKLALTSPADNSFAYDQESLDAPAGKVEVTYVNPATLSHDVILESEDGGEIAKSELISKGDPPTSFTADLQPGTYTYYCDVPGHREGGMEGTLKVK